MHIFFVRYFFFIFFFGFAKFAVAQSHRQLYDSVSYLVLDAYNTQDPRNIYSLTSPTYQSRMSPSSFTNGTKKFYIKVGKWEDLNFREQTDGGMAYTARFEREKQIFFLQLDEQGRILRFNFKPLPFVKSTKNDQVPSNNSMTSATDSLVEKLIRPYIQQGHTTGLCIAVIQNGKVHRYSYGEVKRGSNKLPDFQNTIFEIGSLTKTFTSLLLAREVTRKKMALNDPINKYLPLTIPKLQYHNAVITLLDLANHTSGFPRLPANIFLGNVNPSDPYRHYNEDSLYSFLKTYKPSVIPGTQFSYSNYGAGLLGSILSHNANRSFEQLVLEQICLPLKMNNTRIELREEDSTCFAQGYNENGEPTTTWDLASLQGSGAIKSTLNDMVRYTQAQLGQLHSSLKKTILLTHQVTFQSMDNTIGLGWRIAKQQDNIYWHHSGGTGGFRSFVGFDKKRHFGVVILSNTAEDVTSIGQAILEE